MEKPEGLLFRFLRDKVNNSSLFPGKRAHPCWCSAGAETVYVVSSGILSAPGGKSAGTGPG